MVRKSSNIIINLTNEKSQYSVIKILVCSGWKIRGAVEVMKLGEKGEVKFRFRFVRMRCVVGFLGFSGS